MRTAKGVRVALAAPLVALCAGSAAHAAVVEVRTDADGHQYLSYDAAGGEANQVTVGAFVFGFPPDGDGSHVVTELGARVRLGAGCIVDAPIRCSLPRFGGVQIDGGDRDDRLVSAAHWTDSAVRGGSGDDEIFSDGWYRSEAWGGSGNDTITLSAEDGSFGHGGSGDDKLSTASTTYAELSGDAGDDTLTSGVTGTLDGGAGDDSITFRGRPGTGTVSGGAGADVIDAHGARVDGGSGNDTIKGGTTVSCGSGKDVVHVDAEAVVATDCETVVAHALTT